MYPRPGLRDRGASRSVRPDAYLEGRTHAARHACPRRRPACRAERPGPPGRQLRGTDRHRPARTWRSPRASSATTRPASASRSPMTATWPNSRHLRDQLKAGLSGATPEEGARPAPAGCRDRRPDQGPEIRPHHRARPGADQGTQRRQRPRSRSPPASAARWSCLPLPSRAAEAEAPASPAEPPPPAAADEPADAAAAGDFLPERRNSAGSPRPAQDRLPGARLQRGSAPDEPVLARLIHGGPHDQSLPD